MSFIFSLEKFTEFPKLLKQIKRDYNVLGNLVLNSYNILPLHPNIA